MSVLCCKITSFRTRQSATLSKYIVPIFISLISSFTFQSLIVIYYCLLRVTVRLNCRAPLPLYILASVVHFFKNKCRKKSSCLHLILFYSIKILKISFMFDWNKLLTGALSKVGLQFELTKKNAIHCT